MRQVPSPVTVVTVAGSEEMRGITIGSFTSVSLDPPLISFNVALDAQMHDLITQVDRFVVHVLSDEQAHLSNHFAIPDRRGAEQFADVSYRLNTHGIPILDDVLAVFHCILFAVHPAGDHSLVVGEVIEIEDGIAGRPLLYYNRAYRAVGTEVTANLLEPVNRNSSAAS